MRAKLFNAEVFRSRSRSPIEGDLVAYWIPQIPMAPFCAYVTSAKKGRFLLDTLARYDLFQLEKQVRSDFSNAGGLVEFKSDGWEDWEDAGGNDVWAIKA